jgi:hypothetical protein
MDINTGEQQDSHYPPARFNEKGWWQVWGGDALSVHHFTADEVGDYDIMKWLAHLISEEAWDQLSN